jgi:ABC-type amino acid transport substrate-binding protein
MPARLLAAAPNDVAPDIARILDRGRLIVAARREDTPPFLYTDANGQSAGIDIDVAAGIAARLNVKLDYARIGDSFDVLPSLVAARKADVVISYLSQTLRRAERVRFTQPYVKLRQTVMINRVKTAHLFRGTDHVEVLNDPGIEIGVEDHSSYVDFATERFPKARLLRYASNDEALENLLKGRLHAAMMDEAYAQTLNSSQPGVPSYPMPKDWVLQIRTMILKGATDPIAMAVHRDDSTWLAWLNLYIDSCRDDGSLRRIVSRYLGSAPE